MRAKTVSFDLSNLSASSREETQPLTAETKSEPKRSRDGIYALSAFREVPDEWRFSRMGDCGQVPFRAGVVRFVFFKLFGTGIVALLAAARASNSKLGFGCALSAAVNAVACFHYWLIWSARLQIYPRSLHKFEAPVGKPEDVHDATRIHVQDFFVDGWRFSDWAITLPLMTLELWLLAEDANPNPKFNTTGSEPVELVYADPLFPFPPLNGDWCAALQPVMILLGSVFRFYLNSGNMQKDTAWYFYALAVVCWAGAAAIFGITFAALRHRVYKDGAIDPVDWRQTDAVIIDVVLFVQLGYPAISFFESIFMSCNGGRIGSVLSFLKDAGYGILDTVCKAGLAIYVATRAAKLDA